MNKSSYVFKMRRMKTVGDGEPVVAEADTVGTDEDGNVIARFTFTWSFKRKSS